MKKSNLILIFTLILLIRTTAGAFTDGLISYYSFDTNLNDEFGTFNAVASGHTHNTTNPACGTGFYTLSGSSSYIDTVSGTYNSYSYSYWFTTRATTGYLHGGGANSGTIGYSVEGLASTYIELNAIFGGSADYPTVAGVFSDGNWHHVLVIRNGTQQSMYIDGTLDTGSDGTNDLNIATYKLSLGNRNIQTAPHNSPMRASFDEYAFWNRPLTPTEASQLYNSGNCYNFLTDLETQTEFTAKNLFNDSSILNFSANFIHPIDGNITLESNISGILTINTTNFNKNITHLFYISSVDYNGLNKNINISVTSTQINLTPTDSVQPSFYSTLENNLSASSYLNVEVVFTDYTLTNISLSGCNLNYTLNQHFTNGTYTYNQTIFIGNCSFVYQNITVQACDLSNNCNTSIYTYNHKGNLVLRAFDEANVSVNTFILYNNGAFVGSTTNGTFFIDLLDYGASYKYEIDALGYALKNGTATITATNNYFNYSLNKENSLLIKIYNQVTGELITSLTNITFQFNETETYNFTYSGVFYVSNLNVGNYTILFINSNFTTGSYDVEITNRSWQTLNAYLLPTTSTSGTTTFTLKDYDVGELLENVIIVIQRKISGLWTTIQTLNTDISGRSLISYTAGVEYQFICSKNGYITKTFTLNPISYTDYTIRLQKDSQSDYDQDYNLISLYTEAEFINGENNPVYLSFASPTGNLNNFGYIISYLNTTITNSSNNAYGSLFNNNLTIIEATYGDNVNFYYYYELTNGTLKTFNETYSIIGASNSTNTVMQNKNKKYGLGLFERLLIVTFFALFVAGAGAYFLGEIGAGVGLLLVLSYFTYIGFMDIWASIISIILTFIILIYRGSQ